MGDMSVADFAAVTRNDGYASGEWFWVIILLFAFMGNGWGNNGYNDLARESTMNSQFVERDIAGVNQNVSNSAFGLNTSILENRYANQLAACETQKDVLLGNSTLEKDILLGNQNLAASMSSCCCEIKGLVRDEVQSIKDLINNNTIQGLRDQLNLAEIASANAVQTQNILNQLGRFYTNPSVNPYTCYNCNCGN